MPRDPDCIFCKITAGDIPSHTVYEDEDVFAFLDIGPLAEGHVLIIPRDHHSELAAMPAELCAKIASLLPRLGRAALGVTGAEGFNVLVNNGAAAGQVVGHVHWHLIPRQTRDGLGYRWNAGEYAEGRAAQVADAYKAALASAGR